MLIHRATLWDGTGAAPRRDVTLRFEGERIAWIGPDARTSRPVNGEAQLDAAGRWLLPGLIDLHVHLTLDPAMPSQPAFAAVVPATTQALLGARHARALLQAGFTAARDLGGYSQANVALKRAIDAGWIEGPRLVTAACPITVPGGHFDHVYAPGAGAPGVAVASGPAEVVRAVRQQVKLGADWIKVLVTGGVLSAGTPLETALWEDDELHAAVLAARRLGRPVAAHCHGAGGVIAAAEAGVRTIEHGTMGDEAAAATMARHGVTLVPTFTAAAAVVREARAGRLAPEIAAQALAIEPRHAAAFRAALDAGVRVACGTDTGVPGTAFGENARELGHLVAHGLTAEQALLAATRDAAAVLGWSDRLGTLETGKLADLLLVEGDPLDEPGCLAEPSRLHLVIKGGSIAADRRPEHRARGWP